MLKHCKFEKIINMDFRLIEFGKADAKEEGTELPNLLIEGYLDQSGLAEHALTKSTFLFLGYKGAGKTALSEHIRLTKKDYAHFITTILLSDFPYKSFNKIIPGDGETESRLPTAWELVLLMYILNSLSGDQSINQSMSHELTELTKFLMKYGIFPIRSIKDLVTKTSKTSFKINISEILD